MRNPDPANWGKWSLIPHPELWQAVCLSMDFEPPKSCDVVEFLRLNQKTFKDRMQVCMANLGGKLTAADMHLQHFSPKAARVNLATFAAVASKWGWSIPKQLQEKATLPDEARALKPEPQTAPATPGEKSIPKWLSVTSDYIAGLMKEGRYGKAKELFNALEAKVGTDSPFEKGTGQNRGRLYVREIAATVSLKTMQNNWSEIRSLPR
jgi:hypothetical protein